MATRKAKRKVRTPKMSGRFKISREPVVVIHPAVQSCAPYGSGRLAEVNRRPVLFAMARDERTIFVSWDVDWRSVLDQATPLDRQVHLRLISSDGLQEKTTAVEPMLGNFCMSVSHPRETYRVELGYDTRSHGWKSVAISGPIAMPVNLASRNGKLDLATVPFHIEFQKLTDLLGLTNGEPLVSALARLEDRVISFAGRGGDPAPPDRKTLRELNLSARELRNRHADFSTSLDEFSAGKPSEAIAGLCATSSTSRFGVSKPSQ